jgi:surface antigen
MHSQERPHLAVSSHGKRRARRNLTHVPMMRRLRLALLVACLAAALGIGTSSAATARSTTGSTYLCGPAQNDYNCLAGSGYAGQSVWGSDALRHNCVSYAAYRLRQNGSPQPWSPIGSAVSWQLYAANAGYRVDRTAVVGSIAWWSSNHVAYVESATSTSIFVSEDSYIANAPGYDDRRQIVAGGSDWPQGFIHVKDLTDLFFVKTKNTGSGRVEIHSAPAASGYQSAGQHSVTYFSLGDSDNGWFQMFGGNAKTLSDPKTLPDLYFIKTKNVGSGHVEVHSATAASNYQSGIHSVTGFSPADANNGWFQMDDVDGDGRPDLVFIKTKNTGSGRVEVHWRTAATGFQSGFDGTTYFSPGDSDNGWFQMVGKDLYFVKTKNVGSGHVEVHSATALSNYQSGMHNVTYFSPGDANNGWFEMEGNDLFFIKTKNTGSGSVEVHSATAASNYQDGIHSTSYLRPGDANNGWFHVGNKA